MNWNLGCTVDWGTVRDVVKYVIGLALLVSLAVQAAGATTLGLSPQALAWIAVINTILGGVALWLPPIKEYPKEGS